MQVHFISNTFIMISLNNFENLRFFCIQVDPYFHNKQYHTPYICIGIK